MQALYTTPINSFGTPAEKTTFEIIKVPRAAIEAFKKTDPLFTEFLIESGRVVIENFTEEKR